MSTSTSSTTNHTATPWRVGRQGCVVADAPTSMPGSDDVHYYGGHMVAESIAPRNAAFIVRAVNSHEQLVAALREAIEIIQAIDQTDNTCDSRVDVSEFKAALAAAEA